MPLKELRVPSDPVRLYMCSSMLILKAAIIGANVELPMILRAPWGRKRVDETPVEILRCENDGENM